MKKYRCLLISDFNSANLAGYLNNDSFSPRIEAELAPYNQVIQSLLGKGIDETARFDAAVVWTRPQSVSSYFSRAMNFEDVPHEKALKEVDEFCSVLAQRKVNAGVCLIPLWVIPGDYCGYGILDMKDNIGISNLLAKMNNRLMENLKAEERVFIVNTHKWLERTGKDSFDARMWYMAKIPFSNRLLEAAAADIRYFCASFYGQPRKLVLVDLDDTLWGGIAGDVGINGICLGGHHPAGETFVDFQKALKALTNKGIILGIISRNEENVVMEVIDRHPEMVLRRNDFAGWRINWKDKAENIVELVAELNLGLQSTVFIDDSPVERARVREALPEVYVPEWPKDKMLYASTLLGLSCFDEPSVSSEDRARSRMYAVERKRQTLRKDIGLFSEWLQTLQIKVKLEDLNSSNIQRTVQLFNKTNQMNLTTRRLSELQLKAWAEEEGNSVWVVRVWDKFGDSGLTGCMSLSIKGNEGQIMDFILSCRVMGRRIEETMLYILCRYARAMKLSKVYARYLPTPRNRPCFEFWKSSGFRYDRDAMRFEWDAAKEYTEVPFIEIDSSQLREKHLMLKEARV